MIAFRRGISPKLLLCLLLISSPFLAGCAHNARDETSRAATTGWKIEFDGSGSSPVMVGDVLYVGSADGAAYALDSKTGETRWRFQTGDNLAPAASGSQAITVPRGTSVADQIVAGMNTAEQQRARGTRRIDMTPAVEKGTVFIGAGDHSFYAIDAATGKKKWSYVAGSGMASNNNTDYPVPAPILDNDTAYCVTGDGLHAIDATTGQRKWLFETLREVPLHQMNDVRNLGKRPAKGPVQAESAIFLTAWPFMLSTTPEKSFLYAVAPESGTARWVTMLDGIDITEPMAAKGFVVVATRSNQRAMLYATDAIDGTVRWKLSMDAKLGTSRQLVVGNTVFFSTDTRLVAAELETGRELWSFRADEIWGDLRADDQHLYVATHKGSYARPRDTVHALALATGQPKWVQELSGGAYVSLVSEGVVYAGGRYLYAMDAATGKTLWSFRKTGRESVRLVSGGRLFLISATMTYSGISRVDHGFIYAIDAKTGKP